MPIKIADLAMRLDHEGQIRLSVAISLKRIADALDEVVREGAAINVYAKEG